MRSRDLMTWCPVHSNASIHYLQDKKSWKICQGYFTIVVIDLLLLVIRGVVLCCNCCYLCHRLSERRYCGICVYLSVCIPGHDCWRVTIVSATEVMCCIQCSLVTGTVPWWCLYVAASMDWTAVCWWSADDAVAVSCSAAAVCRLSCRHCTRAVCQRLPGCGCHNVCRQADGINKGSAFGHWLSVRHYCCSFIVGIYFSFFFVVVVIPQSSSCSWWGGLPVCALMLPVISFIHISAFANFFHEFKNCCCGRFSLPIQMVL